MYILLVTATYTEINTTIDWIRDVAGETGKNEIEVLITGVGGTAAAYSITKEISKRTPELILQAGIAGTFNEKYEPPTVVAVKEEVFADLGAAEGGTFDDIFDLGLAAVDEKPFLNRMLVNPNAEKWNLLKLPLVRGATVSRISSNQRDLTAIIQKYAPDLESMEGAALHYACIMEDIPFIQLRAVSNLVGERDKNRWKMKEAIEKLNDVVKKMLTNL